jgi:hypothetical protein
MTKLSETIANLTQRFKALEAKIIHSKALIIILPIIFVLVAFLLYAPYLFNNKNLRFTFEQKISQYTKGNLEIKGEVSIKLLPFPTITFRDAVLKNYIQNDKIYNIYIKKTKLKISFLASLIGNFKINKIEFYDSIIEAQSAKSPLQISSQNLALISSTLTDDRTQEGIGATIFAIDKFNLENFNLENFPKIKTQNLHYISYSKLHNKQEFTNINSELSFSKNHISGSGNYEIQGIKNEFNIDLKASQNKQSKIEINSSYANFKIYGNFANGSFKNFSGDFESEIYSIKSFYKSYVSASGFVLQKINDITKPVKIKSQITKSDKEIKLKNMVISSNLMSGTGNVEINLNAEIPTIDSNFDIEYIDMDAIWLNDKKVTINNEEVKQDISQASLDLSQDLRDYDITFAFKINRIRYLAEEIKNLDLYATVSKQGEILILPLKFEIPGEGKFRINGTIENRKNSPKFVGKIDIKGEKLADSLRWLDIESQNLKYDSLGKYSFYCDIILKPSETILNNVYLNINDYNTEILGEIKMNHYDKNTNIISNFEVHNLDIDNYFLTSGQNSYFSSGGLLKKLLWLNNISANHDITIAFDKLAYKNLNFQEQSLKIRFGNGYLNVDRLKLDSGELNLETSLAIDLTQERPRLDIALKSSNFIYKSSNEVIANENENLAPPQLDLHKFTLTERFFALPSLENFSGNIFFNFENLQIDNFSAKNLKISGTLNNGIYNFNEAKAEIFGGDVDFKGSAGIKIEKSLSGNILLKNAKIKPFLQSLSGIKNIDGTMNFSGSISSFGDKKSSFISNLNSDAKFSAIELKIEKYGLNALIKAMFNPFYFKNELEEPLKILYNEDATTQINKASGAFTIDRGKENRFKIDFSGTAFNGIALGAIDLEKQAIDFNSNIIFLSGSKKRQIPINISSNYKGKFNNILHSDNIDQALQYIKLAKEHESRIIINVQKEIVQEPQEIEINYQQPTKLPSAQNAPTIQLSPEQLQMINESYNNLPTIEGQIQQKYQELQMPIQNGSNRMIYKAKEEFEDINRKFRQQTNEIDLPEQYAKPPIEQISQ